MPARRGKVVVEPTLELTLSMGWSGDYSNLKSETNAILRAVGARHGEDPLFVRRGKYFTATFIDQRESSITH